MSKTIFQMVCFLLMMSQTPLALCHLPENHQQADFYQLIEQDSKATLLQRFELLSGSLMGLPYLAGGSGEGQLGRFDADPLVRFDAFDCTTYVETVLAGLFASNKTEFDSVLKNIRYQHGKVSFVSRNHFPSLDWLPNNQTRLEDVSAQIASQALEYASARIDKAAWYQHLKKGQLTCDDNCQSLHEALRVLTKAIPAKEVQLPYVPLVALYKSENGQINQALLDRIPTPSVISMVRPTRHLKDIIGTNMIVSHQGFLYRREGQLFIRHASVRHQRVMDEDFLDYFFHYTEGSSLKGFNVQKIRL
ncbi:N-acetylmuramoyl-L-alanine amidase-like domain-containing protein [Marinomonas sp. THO17]|uniref:N-acetylmuramoyl-L-alanine amidase-like domain-containing protein n=1 Tax=Marinomonas sp. THO17 TaxID=3149048 RepID=UPI00336C1700